MTEKLVTIEMGTDLILGLKPNTYAFEDDHDQQIEDELNDGYLAGGLLGEIQDGYYEAYDHKKRQHHVFEQYKELYEGELLDFLKDYTSAIKSIKVTSEKLSSPRYYNYGTDWFNFELVIDKAELIKEVKSWNQKDLGKYLKGNFSSYDGFCSFTASKLEELYTGLENETCQEYGAIISYMINDDVEDLLENIDMNGCYADFVSKERLEKYRTDK